MRAKKSSSLLSATGVLKLMTQAMMGAALGLVFGLTLIVSNPLVGALLDHGGNPATFVFVLTVVMTFAIGATLTGVVFILAEDKEF
jgi:hypothetical protein